MEAVALPLPVRRTRRWLDGAASVVFTAGVAALAVLALGVAAGYRPLIERSDSMAPVLRAGDLILTKSAPAADVSVGDIVTFVDASRPGRLVTHRVVAKRSNAATIAFVTRGDANTGVERWSIAPDGTIGRLAWRVPKVGYVISWLALPAMRLLLVSAGALILGGLVLRRIWAG